MWRIITVFVVAIRFSLPVMASDGVSYYEKEVRPILVAHCLKCHGDDPKKIKGGLNLAARDAVLTGGDSGPSVDLANPSASILLKAVHYKDESMQMPPAGKLSPEKIATLEKWVALGLPWTPGATASAGHQEHRPSGPDMTYWAYQPIKRSPPPVVKNKSWVQTPIDAFVLAKLEAKGLTPVGPADRRTLIRRATYDLTGLPPTPQRVDAFVADSSPDAFARLVDELLASPHYGEKWGRHWLDVVRFAETNGYERDGPKPNAWRYRDYVINSFQNDKPFNQFVREQIAGDEIGNSNKEGVIATGFYRLGLWDDEPADAAQALFDGYDDLVTVVGQGFLGMTLNCCRCHDHKGDFFPQADYYKMVAFFRDVRPYSDSRSVVSRNSQTDITPPGPRAPSAPEVQKREARMEMLTRRMTELEDVAIKGLPAEDQRASEGPDRPQVVAKLAGKMPAEYGRLKREFNALSKNPITDREYALSVANCDPSPSPTYILIRGNPGSPGKEVRPGFPSVFKISDPSLPVADAGSKTSGRRNILANFLTSQDNPLTARVWVNRVWQWHFGRGLVPTPNDFGKLGEPCTHPELLDYLAADFMDNGWTLKRLHRQILLSSVYQLSSTASAANLAVDPANTLRWRFDMRRLTAEEVRDSILAVGGELNPTVGGPSVYPKLPAAVLAGQSRPGEGWPTTTDTKEANRRSVYVYIKRSLQVPVLATHDQADTDSSCPVRYTTTVPTQALGMLNGEFSNEQAVALATRLERDAPGQLDSQVALGIRLTTGRNATPAEIARDVELIRGLAKKYNLDEKTSLTRYALMLLNTNEFVYLD